MHRVRPMLRRAFLSCLVACVALPPTTHAADPAALSAASTSSREHAGELRALDDAIKRYESLVAQIGDADVGATARAFLVNYRERREALERSFDPTKHDELRFDLNVESHRLAQWLAPLKTPPVPAPGREAATRPRAEKSPVPLALRRIADLGLTLVPIPAGAFVMGRAPVPGRPAGDESPPTEVTLTHPFWLGATEVTVGQWRKFADATGYRTEAEKGEGMFVWKGLTPRAATGSNAAAVAKQIAPARTGSDPRFEKRAELSWRTPGHAQTDYHPVVGINWDDARAFCAWLNERERRAGRLPDGYSFSLPTEAQWEYACRAGESEDSLPPEAETAWFAGNSGGWTHPVAQKRPNAWGLYDMRGNVWEWCLDWYGAYPGGRVVDWRGPATGTVRESRGGGWNSSGGHGISATNRWNSSGLDRRDNLGFRVALSFEQP